MDTEEDFVTGHEEVDSDDNEADGDNERAHLKMLDAISSLDGKSRLKRTQRTEAAAKISEFHTSSGKEKVRLHELIGALRSNTNLGTLKKQLNRVQKKKKVLQTPLAKHEQEKIQRNLAYEATTSEVSKWDSVVQKNRKADQLQFPLDKPSLKLITSDQFVKRFTPRTSLEKEVAALLRGSAHTQLPKQRELTEAEEKALKAMSIEEARERRAELQKYRALLSYKEAKARRQAKIKSKKYHRILRKEKFKQQNKSLEELQKTDPQAFAETLQRLETSRMKERMSLKHRGGSKFMASQKLFAKYDAHARQAVQEMNQKSRQLTKKLAVESESEEGEEVEEVVVENTNRTALPGTSSNNPWMSVQPIKKTSQKKLYPSEQAESTEVPETQQQEIEESSAQEELNFSADDESVKESETKQKSDLDTADIEEIFATAGKRQKAKERRIQRKKKRALSKRERGFDESATLEDSSDDSSDSQSEDKAESVDKKMQATRHQAVEVFEPRLDSFITASLTRKQALEDFEAEWSGSDSEDEKSVAENESLANPTDGNTLPLVNKPDSTAKPAEKDLQVDPKKFLTVEHKIRSLQKPELVDNEDDEEGNSDGSESDDQRMTIAQAFASDDVVDEFLAEKKDVEERDKPKDIDLTLPGWGDWGGVGVQPSKRKKKRFTLKASAAPPRKDRNLDTVIISETKDTAVAKHQVSELPFPFTSVQQFESTVRAPIGKTWNPETAYRELIKPKVVTKIGAVISPIDKASTFKKQQKAQKRPKADIDIEVGDGKQQTSKRQKGGGGRNLRGKKRKT